METHLSRRAFLKSATALAAAGLLLINASCAQTADMPAELPAVLRDMTPPGLKYPAVPPTPDRPPVPGQLRVFTVQEAQTVEAITARIMPGTPADPGAREAGVVTYIDNLLANTDGFAEPTYRQAPFAQVYTGTEPPADAADYAVIWVSTALIGRYGYQAILTPREVYRIGLEALNRYADDQFGGNFADLTEDEQDTIVEDLAQGRATGFAQVSAGQFFQVLRRHTAEGMFSDPAYGGNRELAGWRLIGFPGAQRAWTAAEIQTEGVRREPQPHTRLEPFNPGQPSRDGVVLPLSGSDPRTWHDAHQPPPATAVPTKIR